MSSTVLHHLADLFGIKTSYTDMNGAVKIASDEVLIAVLKSLGAPIDSLSDVPGAIREKSQTTWHKLAEPVLTSRDDDAPQINLRFQANRLDSSVFGSLELETGESRTFIRKLDQSSVFDYCEVEGIKYVSSHLKLPERLPRGYHKLHLSLNDQECQTLIISAPKEAFSPEDSGQKLWGIFLPLYSFRAKRNRGMSNFSDLETLMKWTRKLGGQMVGTLPLLASFFDDEFGPGPYLPASKLFWNEYYVDITVIPELKTCPEAKALVNSASFQDELDALGKSERVIYSLQMELKRKVLHLLAECFFRRKSGRYSEFLGFIGSHPDIEEYARFRATVEKNRSSRPDWNPPMNEGMLLRDDYSEKAMQYHLYTQWICHQQVLGLSERFKKQGSYLYLDLPVGVHPYSYDVWKYRSTFVRGVNVGAPPDLVFTNGQNWSFPPLNLDKLREQGYDYLIKALRHQLEFADVLRIDHMMGFHRLFYIPEGMPNSEGVYVKYPAQELYSILALESSRHQAIIIGEDLGMVPPEVRPMMKENGIFRMFVGQYELITENGLGSAPEKSVATLNTHDMFPFASFWEEEDILKRQQLNLVNADESCTEMGHRRHVKETLTRILQSNDLLNKNPDTYSVLKTLLRLLAASPAWALLINLEDLWLEKEPQNIPGTNTPRNWTKKAKYSLEQIRRTSQIKEMLTAVDRVRKGVRPKHEN